VGTKDAVADIGFRAMNRLHRMILGVSRGKVLGTAFGMPTLQLHTIGRTSGQVRTTMLTSPVYDEDRVVLVASKGGDDRDPQWYRNLGANPDVEVTMHGVTRPLRARTATPAERAELWPLIVQAYKGYAGYQERSAREIPVVICERRPS